MLLGEEVNNKNLKPHQTVFSIPNSSSKSQPLDIRTKMAAFYPISNGFRRNGCHFVEKGRPLENITEGGYHWNSERFWYSSPHCIANQNKLYTDKTCEIAVYHV